MDHIKHVCSTLQKRSCGTEAKIIGSIVVTFPNLTSGMYSAQTTCAQPVNTYKNYWKVTWIHTTVHLYTYITMFLLCTKANQSITCREVHLVLQSLIAWKKKTHSASHNWSYVSHITQAQSWKSFWVENSTSLLYLPILLLAETWKMCLFLFFSIKLIF